CAIWHSSAWVF
nr:immunoglobulin light chain junction region [Macaca mulatta]MPO05531.1 immunoglobulin light chain junction region [Macaca mulatta]MPO06936.1 immunoglobulin light chain junction region [Macaca mulatta]MPO08090.1 immunoglobulin light chain junction region [Macaca mulatta]MPO08359.1 immunoglobulin light chain junction region [Macaca mulatta]